MKTIFTRRVGMVAAASLGGALLLDVGYQVYTAHYAEHGLYLFDLPALWVDPLRHKQVYGRLVVYGFAALVSGFLANSVLADHEDNAAYLGHEVIEASLGDLKKKGLLNADQEGPARRRFWWQFWDAAKHDRR